MSVLLCVSGELEVQIVEHLAEVEPPIEVLRRCADLIELVASAEAGVGSIAIVDDIDVTTAADLHLCGIRIIGVLQRMDPAAARHVGCDAIASPFADDVVACLRGLGNHTSRPADGTPDDSGNRAAGAHGADARNGGRAIAGDAMEYHDAAGHQEIAPLLRDRAMSGPMAEGSSVDAAGENGAGGVDRRRAGGVAGRVIAVWGSSGSPGRSTVARDLAWTVATQIPTLLVDADVHSPSMAQLVGLDQETSALVAVARAINTGEEGPALIERACTRLSHLDLLPGLNTGARWREVPRPVADKLWATARRGWEFIVVDCAAQSEARGHGFEMERDGVTLSLLDEADDVLIVGQAGPLGLRRLIAQLDQAADLGIENPRVVVTKLSRRPMHTRSETAAVLLEAGIHEFVGIHDGRDPLMQAENRGLVLHEASPTCAAAKDIVDLAERLLGRAIPPRDVGARASILTKTAGAGRLRSVLRGLRGKRLRVLSSENPAGAAHHVTGTDGGAGDEAGTDASLVASGAGSAANCTDGTDGTAISDGTSGSGACGMTPNATDVAAGTAGVSTMVGVDESMPDDYRGGPADERGPGRHRRRD